MMEQNVTGEERILNGKIIEINENEFKTHVDEVVRNTVQQTLNLMLDQEADELCQAKKYERSTERVDTRGLVL